MKVSFTAEIIDDNGKAVGKRTSEDGGIPSLKDFDLSTKEGFLRDFDILEKAPGFCSPTAFIIPLAVSMILGAGFPSQGWKETPFVTTAPSRSRSTNSLYSCPEPNVPDAGITGFFSVMPAISTDVSIPSSSFLEAHYNSYPRKAKYCLFSFIVLKMIPVSKNIVLCGTGNDIV